MRCVVDQRGLKSVSINDLVNNRFRSNNRDNSFMDHCLVKAWTQTRVSGCVMDGSPGCSESLSSFFCNFWFVEVFLLFMSFLVVGFLVVDFVMKGSFADKSIIIVHLENKVAILDVDLALHKEG